MATVAIASFVLLSADGAAQDTGANLRFSTGLEYATGKYGGTDDIEELYVPFTFRAGFDRIGLRLTVPYLRVTAPEDTIITEPGTEPAAEPEEEPLPKMTPGELDGIGAVELRRGRIILRNRRALHRVID